MDPFRFVTGLDPAVLVAKDPADNHHRYQQQHKDKLGPLGIGLEALDFKRPRLQILEVDHVAVHYRIEHRPFLGPVGGHLAAVCGVEAVAEVTITAAVVPLGCIDYHIGAMIQV